jgi:hypothetical protein
MTIREVLTISKTNDLRKLVQTRLKDITPLVYYRKADEDALYPHIVHLIDRVNILAEHRDDVSLVVDIWTKSDSVANELADAVEKSFDRENLPQETILPTFFLETRIYVEDDDKNISHIQMTFTVQNYER